MGQIEKKQQNGGLKPNRINKYTECKWPKLK